MDGSNRRGVYVRFSRRHSERSGNRLAADTSQSGKKALAVVRARSSELMRLSEQTGEDLLATSTSFIDVLLLSLRSDLELPWSVFEQKARSRAACAPRKAYRSTP